jgi:hypothetical protein
VETLVRTVAMLVLGFDPFREASTHRGLATGINRGDRGLYMA